MSLNLHGTITALAAPFKNGELDERSFRRLVARQIAEGVNGLVINGTTGESPTIHITEAERMFAIAKEECGGQIPIIVGTGSNSTLRTIELTRIAASWGADAALVVTPYYNKPPQRGLRAHFEAVADSGNLPVVLYNVPGRTITAIAPETTIELSAHPKIVGLKEASGDLNYLKAILGKVPRDFALLSGDDATCVEFCAHGGHGVISVFSHVIAAELAAIFKSGKSEGALNEFGELLRLIYIESNPIPVKAALYLMGVFDSMEMRLPLVPLNNENLVLLRNELRRLGKIGD